MIYNATATSNGTSYHGVSFMATPQQLINALGNPTKVNQDKVSMIWVKELNTADVFTIYDWKLYRELKTDETIEWNIGAINEKISLIAKEEILNLLK